jgi:hypothetical protein
MLRKLATGHLFLDLPGTTQEIWDRFRIRNIGFAVQRRIAKDHAGGAAVASQPGCNRSGGRPGGAAGGVDG